MLVGCTWKSDSSAVFLPVQHSSYGITAESVPSLQLWQYFRLILSALPQYSHSYCGITMIAISVCILFGLM